MSGEITKESVIKVISDLHIIAILDGTINSPAADMIEKLYLENQEMKELLKDIDNSEEDLCCPYCGTGNFRDDNIKERIDKFIND